MSKQLYTVSKEGLEYLCGLINKIVTLPSDVISDITLSTNKTMSSVKIDKIIKQCLQDANEYSNEVVNSLTHLVAEKIDFEPTLDNTTDKINTLLLYSANSDNNYTQYLRLTNELLNLGDTSLSLNEYMKEVDADTKYTLKTTTDTLVTEVNNIKSDFTTHKNDTDIHTSADEKASYVKKTDIVDNLTSTDTNKPLSANQGKVLEDNKLDKTTITTTINSSSTDTQVPSAKAVYTLDQNNFKMNASMLFNSDRDCTDGNLIIGQEYTASEPILPHKMARLSIWWKTCHFSQATWLNDTWGYIDGYVNEFVSDTNHFHINTVRVLFRHADTKQFKVQYSKRVDFDLTSGTFTCVDLQGRCGFGIQIYK